MGIFRSLAEWPRRPADALRVGQVRAVLLGDPRCFRTEAAINPHMLGPDGELKAVDGERARAQWSALRQAYESLGIAVEVLEAHPDLPDLCFTANPSLVLPLPAGGCELWLGRMAHSSRAREVAHHLRFANERGIPVREMPESVARFEGTGDGVLHPGRFVLHAGVGARTAATAWETIAEAHPELDVLLYELADDRFYHLDTALAPLTESCALIVPRAFTPRGLELVRGAFPQHVDVDEEEALAFAANAHCPDGRHVLIHAGCPRVSAALEERGFTVLPLDTGEFLKSGGSVFCLKQSLY